MKFRKGQRVTCIVYPERIDQVGVDDGVRVRGTIESVETCGCCYRVKTLGMTKFGMIDHVLRCDSNYVIAQCYGKQIRDVDND